MVGVGVSASTADISSGAAWSRGRLRAILCAVVAFTVVVLVGLGYAVHLAVAGVGSEGAHPGANQAHESSGGSPDSVQVGSASRRDQIAAEPMLAVPPGAALPALDADDRSPTIEIPAATGVTGPAFIMTGFPQSPEGAVGQLAEIDTAVLQSLSLRTALEVHQAWALPGGAEADEWWITVSLRAFLTSAGIANVGHPRASLTVEPAAALVKGVDGPDWATVCVLLEVSASYQQDGRTAFAHCERMQWVGGRWMLAPGAPPAEAPATWPGTRLALAAGWRTWATEADESR